LGHQFNQPLWKENRYHLSCRACGARLKPTLRDRIGSFAMLLAGAGATIGVFSVFRAMPPFPENLLIILVGVLVGTSAGYPMARYELVDRDSRPQVPDSRATERSE
jgi:hypothetical protein